MSRSMKKTPIGGCCVCRSEKKDKFFNHKRERQAVRMALHYGDEVMPHTRELSDPWNMGKDGKTWFGDYYCENSWMEDNLRRMLSK